MKEGRKPEYSEKTPDDKLQKMPHTKARQSKPQAKLEPAFYHWWQARKADVLTIKPRVMLRVQNQLGHKHHMVHTGKQQMKLSAA